MWVGGETAKWPNVAQGETDTAFLCLFGMSDPPQLKNYFLMRLCFVDEACIRGVHLAGSVAEAEQGARWGGMTPPPIVRDATASWAQSYAPKGAKPTKRGSKVVVMESEEGPPPHPQG